MTEITTTNQGGRPSKYDPKYCQLLQDHMAKGFSFETFGAVAGVCRATLYNWLHEHADFKQAKDRAFCQSLYFYESLAIEHLQNPMETKGFHFGLWKFIMQSRFPTIYGSRTEKEVTIQPQAAAVPVRESEIILSSGFRIPL